MQTTSTSQGSTNRPPPGRPPTQPQARSAGGYPATPSSPVGTYWVIFRLADALGPEQFQSIKAEEEAANQAEGGDDTALRRRIAKRLEQELDAGHGDCWLRDEQVARLVQSALQAGHGRQYSLRAWSILPNHLHVVFTVSDGVDAGAIVRDWRSYTTSQVNLALDRGAHELWERQPYLRALRDEVDVKARIRNVEFRAVNAGLCRRPREWRWSSAHEYAPAPLARGPRAGMEPMDRPAAAGEGIGRVRPPAAPSPTSPPSPPPAPTGPRPTPSPTQAPRPRTS